MSPRADTQEAEDLIRLISYEGKLVKYTTPGEIVCDLDGIPIGIDPGETSTATIGQVALSSTQWELIARYLITERSQNNG